MLVAVAVAQPMQAALVRPPLLRHRNNRRFHGLHRRCLRRGGLSLRSCGTCEHNWSAYEEALKANPVLAKMMVSGGFYSLGDWIAQAFEYFGEMPITSVVLERDDTPTEFLALGNARVGRAHACILALRMASRTYTLRCSSAAVDPCGVLFEFLRPLAARQQMRVWDGGGSNFEAVVYWAYNFDMINDMNRFYRRISLRVTGSLATAETYFDVIVIDWSTLILI
ncbi:hypothetical protein CFC21_072400 [Triticum aestivum]|uniref:Uncharacterized protein n=3 Tax=Triticum TaxID=4564 RepID=A0A9R0XCU9_TRITD|nr:hypothetical protein CFC21_072400 [Triticum aestivum]VAI34195.1 unnamed protein product [Triticum turgidum subsp. durum]